MKLEDVKYYEEYRSRIAYLQEVGNDEGIEFDPDSVNDFWRWVKEFPNAPKAELVMLDSRQLRAWWETEDSMHSPAKVAIIFTGGNLGDYVIYGSHDETKNHVWASGWGTLGTIKEVLKAYDLVMVWEESEE